MKGKYITTQIRITSLSHKNKKKPFEIKERKVADLSTYLVIWKKEKVLQ